MVKEETEKKIKEVTKSVTIVLSIIFIILSSLIFYIHGLDIAFKYIFTFGGIILILFQIILI